MFLVHMCNCMVFHLKIVASFVKVGPHNAMFHNMVWWQCDRLVCSEKQKSIQPSLLPWKRCWQLFRTQSEGTSQVVFAFSYPSPTRPYSACRGVLFPFDRTKWQSCCLLGWGYPDFCFFFLIIYHFTLHLFPPRKVYLYIICPS